MNLISLFKKSKTNESLADIEPQEFQVESHRSGADERKIWVDALTRIINPVLENMANETLIKNMPVETTVKANYKFAHLEAVGRTVCGIGPWLELGPKRSEEGKLRKKYIDLLIKGLNNVTNPESEDYLVWEVRKDERRQPLVDAAHLAEGLVRSKNQIWNKMDNETKELVLDALIKTRNISPYKNNWLLFPSMIEAFILDVTGECDYKRLEKGVNRFRDKWYAGDSFYNDGKSFHMDFYNSYVIHPMLVDTLEIMRKHDLDKEDFYCLQLKRLSHYASFSERLISPEGTYPLLGRSMLYRTAAFQALGQSVLLKNLDDNLKPAQVRCGLTKVIQNQFGNDANFNSDGWLVFGFNGRQYDIAEKYSNTGSMYLCTTGFLPLGLSKKDPFWSEPFEEWTSLKAWNGGDVKSAMFVDF